MYLQSIEPYNSNDLLLCSKNSKKREKIDSENNGF